MSQQNSNLVINMHPTSYNKYQLQQIPTYGAITALTSGDLVRPAAPSQPLSSSSSFLANCKHGAVTSTLGDDNPAQVVNQNLSKRRNGKHLFYIPQILLSGELCICSLHQKDTG